MCWKFFDQESQRWWPENPSLPQWFIDDGGELRVDRFVRIWQAATSFSDVKKQLFWMSSSELMECKHGIDQRLRERGYASLIEHSLERIDQEGAVYEQLASEGILSERSSDAENALSSQEQGYDPVAALFQAQDQLRTKDGGVLKPHIETLEGAMRFRIRH